MRMACPKCGRQVQGQTGDQCPQCKLFLWPAEELAAVQPPPEVRPAPAVKRKRRRKKRRQWRLTPAGAVVLILLALAAAGFFSTDVLNQKPEPAPLPVISYYNQT